MTGASDSVTIATEDSGKTASPDDPMVLVYVWKSGASDWDTAYNGFKSGLKFDYVTLDSGSWQGRFTSLSTGEEYRMARYDYVCVYEDDGSGWKETVPAKELEYWDASTWAGDRKF